MYLAPIHGPGVTTGGAGIALPAQLLNKVSCMEPVVFLSGFIQDLFDTKVTS
jgi:hypothetical protein